MSTVQDDIGKLTAKQREALINPVSEPWPWSNVILINRGLLSYRRRWWLLGERRLVHTRRGVKVRDHLLSHPSGKD